MDSDGYAEDVMPEEALALGFTVDEYLTRVRKLIKEKKEMMKYIKLVFIECNIEQMIKKSKKQINLIEFIYTPDNTSINYL